MRRLVFVPVLLDCGCTVTPARGREPIESGGALVVCTGHGIRHSVDVVEEVITITYTAKRLDPADPEPETVDA